MANINKYRVGELQTEDQSKIIEIVKQEAEKYRICFGSEEAAIYHIIIHKVKPISQYVQMANELITNPHSVPNITPTGSFNVKDIEFKLPETGGMRVVLLKNGELSLKTFLPKKR
jgi:hypothetical protein